jgi:hypothetical protein
MGKSFHDPTDLCPAGNEDPTITPGKPGIWKMPLRVFKSSDIKEIKKKKTPWN